MYPDLCQQEYDSEAIKKAAGAGSSLIVTAGTASPAGEAIDQYAQRPRTTIPRWELLSKAWKDAAKEVVLLIDAERDAIAQILHLAGIAESPLGQGCQQIPDRTVSAEGRPIHDVRTQNSKGSKYNHPPAPQPRHKAVAASPSAVR